MQSVKAGAIEAAETIAKQDQTQESSSHQVCERCNDSWFIPLEKNTVKRCPCRKERAIADKLALIPPEFANSTLKTYWNRQVGIIYKRSPYEAKMRLPVDFDYRESYYLYGANENAKTRLMWAQFRALTEAGIFKTYAETAIDLVYKYQQQKYEKIKHFDFKREGLHIFVDDLGKGRSTEDASLQLHEIFDTLLCNKAKVTITSNYSLSELAEQEILGANSDSIVSRIKRICNIVRFKDD